MKTSRRAAEVNNKSDVKNGWAAQYRETTGVTRGKESDSERKSENGSFVNEFIY